MKTDASGFKIAEEETETKIDSYIQKVASLEEDLSHMQVLKSQLTETKGALITCQQELSAALEKGEKQMKRAEDFEIKVERLNEEKKEVQLERY